jgi:hypothetical protein
MVCTLSTPFEYKRKDTQKRWKNNDKKMAGRMDGMIEE